MLDFQTGNESVIDFLETVKFLRNLLTPIKYERVENSMVKNVIIFGAIGAGKSTTLNALMN